ncbi:hypothetical protein OQ257_10925, partial [Actinobacillus equuli subsp. equuli]
NSEVKRSNADGSVGLPHVRVGHRQIAFRDPVVSDNHGVFAFLQRTTLLFYLQPQSQSQPHFYLYSASPFFFPFC